MDAVRAGGGGAGADQRRHCVEAALVGILTGKDHTHRLRVDRERRLGIGVGRMLGRQQPAGQERIRAIGEHAAEIIVVRGVGDRRVELDPEIAVAQFGAGIIGGRRIGAFGNAGGDDLWRLGGVCRDRQAQRGPALMDRRRRREGRGDRIGRVQHIGEAARPRLRADRIEKDELRRRAVRADGRRCRAHRGRRRSETPACRSWRRCGSR